MTGSSDGTGSEHPSQAPGVTARTVHRAQSLKTGERDRVAVEEPLEIRLAGDPLAVTMRTPGRDQRLAVGFLMGEGIIRNVDDLGSVFHCGRAGEEGYGNIIDCVPAAGTRIDPERTRFSRRGTVTTASCGVCGRRTIQDLLVRIEPLPPGPGILAQTVVDAAESLGALQPTFQATGGVHGAAALDAKGIVLACEEDIGRHNAVDKVVGELAYRHALGAAAILVVSGRASFEMVQKAAAARIPFVVSVSAASSMAIDLAEKANLTLIGFTRGQRFTVYAHPERVESSAPFARGR
jgi:FdhD protein